MIEKAAASAADQVFMDLEDACAPGEKVGARALVVEALTTLDFGAKLRVVRVNGVGTPWCHGDVTELVTGAGATLDCILLPKVEAAIAVRVLEVHVRPVDRLQPGGAGVSRDRAHRPAPLMAGVLGIDHPELESRHAQVGCVVSGAEDERLGPDRTRSRDLLQVDHPGAGLDQRRTSTLSITCSPDSRPSSASSVGSGSRCLRREQALGPLVQLLRGEATGAGLGAAVHEGKMIDEATRKLAEKLAAAGRAAGLKPPHVAS